MSAEILVSGESSPYFGQDSGYVMTLTVEIPDPHVHDDDLYEQVMKTVGSIVRAKLTEVQSGEQA